VCLFIYARNPARLVELERFRYLGAFLVSLIGNASVLLPGIVLPILTALGIDFYRLYGDITGPLIIAVLGATGAAIGEMMGYAAGYSGRAIVRTDKRYTSTEARLRQWGSLGIFGFSLLPLFFDLVGLAAGILRFPVWKFLLLCFLGRLILYSVVITLAARGYDILVPLFS
jgi:membrane protein YqaA with SNARE-associated domain